MKLKFKNLIIVKQSRIEPTMKLIVLLKNNKINIRAKENGDQSLILVEKELNNKV